MIIHGKFILSNTAIVSQTKDFIEYKFTCKQMNIINLLKNINYSTNKETLSGQESPYKIIMNINNKIQNLFDNQYIETSRKIHFISSQNSSALDIIDYCLKMGVSEKDLPSYFFTRIADKKSMIFNQLSIINNLNKFINPTNINLTVQTNHNDNNQILGDFTTDIMSNSSLGR